MSHDLTQILTDMSVQIGECKGHAKAAADGINRINGTLSEHIKENDSTFTSFDSQIESINRRINVFTGAVTVLIGIPAAILAGLQIAYLLGWLD